MIKFQFKNNSFSSKIINIHTSWQFVYFDSDCNSNIEVIISFEMPADKITLTDSKIIAHNYDN